MEDTIAVMTGCTNGVLACLGDEGYPYAVPLSYVYSNGRIYIHSAKAGHKIDAITKNPKVSFSVIDEDKIVSEEYTTYFRSVIAFGKSRIIEGDERLESFAALVEKPESNLQPNGSNSSRTASPEKMSLQHLLSKRYISSEKLKPIPCTAALKPL